MQKRTLTLALISTLIFVLLLSSCANSSEVGYSNDSTVRIGIGSFDDYLPEQIDFFINDLKERFEIDVVFVELDTGARTTEEYINMIDMAFENNCVDMAIGIPSYYVPTLIANDRLLDITDYLTSLDNIHKGVIDISQTRGDGRMYFISPVFSIINILFSNNAILNELGVGDSLQGYVGWVDLLEKLDEIATAESRYSPIALSTGRARGDDLYLATEFLMQSQIISNHLVEDNKLTDSAKEFFKTYAEIAVKHGKSNEELLNGILPRNLIFAGGDYAYMVGNILDLEILFNSEYNNNYNMDVITDQEKVIVNIPMIGVSFVNIDGSKTQNLRESAIFINKHIQNIDVAIDILNVFMGKEYALKVIANREYHSLFSASTYTFPSYFDNETIAELNKLYSGKFDVSLIYDVEFGNVIEGMYINDFDFIVLLNESFTQIRKAYEEGVDMNAVLEDAIIYINNSIQ